MPHKPVTDSVWWRVTLRTRYYLTKGPKTAKTIEGCYRRAHKIPTYGVYEHLAWLEHMNHGYVFHNVWRLTPLGMALAEADRPPVTVERKSIRSHIETISAQYNVPVVDLLGSQPYGPSVPARDHLMANLIDDGWDVNTIAMNTNFKHERIKLGASRYWFRLNTRGAA